MTALAQSSASTSQARAMARQGLAAYERRDFAEALRMFTEAEKLVHATPHQLYMARSHAELGHPVEAFELYNVLRREVLDAKAPQAFVDAKAAAEAEIASVEAKISMVTLKLGGDASANATLLVDGKPIPAGLLGVRSPMNPGKHVLSASGDGISAQPLEIEVQPGSTADFTLPVETATTPPPAAEPAKAQETGSEGHSKVPAYVAFGVGGVGVVLGAVFTALHFDKAGQADKMFTDYDCAAGCSTARRSEIDALDQDAATNGTFALIGYGVGAAGVATGITLWILDEKATEERPAASLRPSVKPYFGFGHVGLSGRF